MIQFYLVKLVILPSIASSIRVISLASIGSENPSSFILSASTFVYNFLIHGNVVYIQSLLVKRMNLCKQAFGNIYIMPDEINNIGEIPSPKRLRRKTLEQVVVVTGEESSPPQSPRSPSVTKEATSSINDGLDVTKLPSREYEIVMQVVEQQIKSIITAAIGLQSRSQIIEKIVLFESAVWMIVNSITTQIGNSVKDELTRQMFMYVFFGIGIILSVIGLLIKWLKQKQDRDIDSYRNLLKELVDLYEQDAWFAIERERMKLPSDVLAHGFFRGLTKKSGSSS